MAIDYESDGRIRILRFNRPEKRNALDPAHGTELTRLENEFNDDPEAWGLILTGAGDKAFCAGDDLDAVVGGVTSGKIKFQPEPRRWFSHCYKPIVPAVNGFATGGGMELVMLTDIRIAAQHAGNCDRLVQKALEAAREIEGVETEFISLADKRIAACTNCQWCIEDRSRCKVKDDVHEVHDRMFEADGLILGGPTYNQVFSTQLINVFSRGREEIFFAHRLANEGIPGSAVTLGWFGMGMESWGVFPVASGSAISSTAWKGLKADYSPNGVLDDLRGVFLVQERCGRRLAKMAKMMKYARDGALSAAYAVARRDKELI